MGKAVDGPKRPLYLMVKPPPSRLPEVRRLYLLLDIQSGYSLDRVHCTFLPLGESEPRTIAATHRALADFGADPFPVMFDHAEGGTLKPCKGLRRPGTFQRALARHVAAAGVALPPYGFGLHMNLCYPPTFDRRARIPLLSWTVEEILLVESVHGQGRHVEHGRWRLFPRQGSLF